MDSASIRQLHFSPEPDLNPLYPTTSYIAPLISPHSSLSSPQRATLVANSLTRACVFGELSVLQYLISDPQAQPHLELGFQDEDGQGLVTLVIHGFGADSDRDVEREECVRLLVGQGAYIGTDKGDVKVSCLQLQFTSDEWLKLVGRPCIMPLSYRHRRWSPT
jgi:hypothetical protein